MATSEKIKTVFQAAVDEATPVARAAYLDVACGSDVALRLRVESLLQAHERSDLLLDRPVEELLAGTEAPADDEAFLDFLEPPSRDRSLGRLGHYEILEVAGHGGMGIVFRAFDEKLRRVVAVKALEPALAANAAARERFVREARAAAAVTHDNVIAIHAVEDAAGSVPYLVMPFVEGTSLQAKIERCGPLPLTEVLRIGLQVAEGLAAAHRQGLIHRDVKPANILLENGVERVKITDFGLARAADDDADAARGGPVAGTPTYMSPEQARGEAVDARSDLFSLGSVLYAMCTGRAPFRASTTIAVLQRVCEEAPGPVREVVPELPEWLEQLIRRLHAKDPADRFPSARELADVLAQRLAESRDGGGGSRPAARRRYGVAVLGTLVAAVATVSLIQALGVNDTGGTGRRYGGGEGNPATTMASPSAESEAAAWERRVAVMAPAEQAAEVAARLKRLNPNYDGTFKYRAADNVVDEFRFSSEWVSDVSPVRALEHLAHLECSGSWENKGRLVDLSPLRGLPLRTLLCQNTRVSDLAPLAGMPLQVLDAGNTSVSDLSPLAGMPLVHVVCSLSKVRDLSPLAGMRLDVLMAEGLPITDVSALRGMPLRHLGLYHTRVSDITPLAGMPVEYLNLTALPVSDLSTLRGMTNLQRLVIDDLAAVTDIGPLRGLQLRELQMHRTPAVDLSPLRGMPLVKLSGDDLGRDPDLLRSFKTLERINGKPAAEFWEALPK